MFLHQLLIIFILHICCLLSTVSSTQVIPSILKICHRNDPQLGDCIKESINSLKPYLKKGIQSLGVPPCEPFYIKNIELDHSSGPIEIRTKYSDVSVFGLSDIVVKSIRLDTDKNRMRLKCYIPKLQITSNYDFNATIMHMPLKANGIGHVNLTDVDTTITLQMVRYRDKRTELIYQRVDDINLDFEFGNATIRPKNVYNSEDLVFKAMNLYLNDNRSSIIEEVKPKLASVLSDSIKNVINNIFSAFPEDVLLPP